MPRLSSVLFGVLLPLATLAAETDGRSIPYEKLYAPLVAVKQADPEGIVTSSLRAEAAQPDQPLPTDLKIEMRNGSAHLPIALGVDGTFTLPMHPEWATGDATLWVNQPKSTVKIVENFTMRTPATTHLDYGRLMESLPVMERLQNQKAEISGLMSSKPQGVELAYPAGTSQTVTVGTGPKATTWQTDDHGIVEIPFDEAVPASTPVVLSAQPVALQPYAR